MDSYAVGESSARIGDLLLQVLKDIARDFTGIDRPEPNREDKTAAANPQVRLSEEGSGKATSINSGEINDKAGSISGRVAESLTGSAAFGGEEIAKNLAMNSVITNATSQLPDNNVSIKNISLFVDSVSALLNDSPVVGKCFADTLVETEVGLSSNKQRVLEQLMLEKGLWPITQASAKNIILQDEEFRNFQFIGLSIDKNNLLYRDMPALEEALTSKKEETLNVIKGLGNSLYERANSLTIPYAGIYADDKPILQLRASQKDEEALLLDKQLKEEQGALEKRLNELQLLIERSTYLQDWLIEGNKTQTGA